MGTLTSSGDLASQLVVSLFYQAVEGTRSLGGNLLKETSKGLSGTFTSTGSFTRETLKELEQDF